MLDPTLDIIRVYNLTTATREPELTYQGITPRQAVIAAYAQSLGDYNTWDYETRYADLVSQGYASVNCGDFAAYSPSPAAIRHSVNRKD